jgi:threonine aldolase
MLGGAMRQSGIYAGGGHLRDRHNLARLAEDHANARLIAERIAERPRVKLDLATVQTNILVFHLADEPPTRTPWSPARATAACSLRLRPRTLRLVTHLDVTRSQCEAAAGILFDIIANG